MSSAVAPENDGSSSDEEELLSEVKKWAETKEQPKSSSAKMVKQEKKKRLVKKPTHRPELNKPIIKATLDFSEPQKFSVHITNISRTASKQDIFRLFSDKGCFVTSTRLCYDGNGKDKIFKGVAFVDFANKESYEKALTLNRTHWDDFIETETSNQQKPKRKRGKHAHQSRINVRPTRTKAELKQIVETTKERVSAMKRSHRDKRTDNQDESTKPGINSKRQKISPTKSKGGRDDSSIKSKSSSQKGKSKESSGNKNNQKKLTKKERAKKAAIIRTKR